MTSTLRTLLDRVEQGEGADMALNWDVADAFGMVPAHRIVETGFDHGWYRRAGEHALWKANDSEGRDMSLWQPANVTGSIDAAVDLVEKALPGWAVGYEPRYYDDGEFVRYRAILSAVDWSKYTPYGDHIARTEDAGRSTSPARAIVAALLRAKIAQEGEQ